jgi:ribonucleotide monophosphatase NagD (HAD superfamily)
MPGQLARRYQAMGARDVRLVGKPHRLIYHACRRQPGVAPDARIVGIGDSLPHDVLGAHAAGIDSAFVCSGVHCRELGVRQASDQIPEGARLAELLAAFDQEHGCAPTHVLSAFRL